MWDKEPQPTYGDNTWMKYRLRNSSVPEEQKQSETIKDVIRRGRIVIDDEDKVGEDKVV